MRLALLYGLLGLLLLPACKSEKRPPTVQTDIPFRNDGTLAFLREDGSVAKSIQVEIAETEEARTRGLMGRRAMTLDQGMLFVFQRAEPQGFWMRNTPLPLDIIFVGADSTIVNIARRTRPLSDSLVSSAGPAQYVVEVRGGFSDRYGLQDSLRVRWQRTATGEPE
jgi:uncharacterized membrane protein (UPF0127 family)